MKEWPTLVRTGSAAQLADGFRDGPGSDEIVDDRGARLPGQEPSGDQSGSRASRQRVALIVDEGGAVGVAVKGNSQIGTPITHQGDDIDQILGLQRIGGVIGERPIRFQIQPDDVGRNAVEDGLRRPPRPCRCRRRRRRRSSDIFSGSTMPRRWFT